MVGGNALILALHDINDTLDVLDVLVTLATLGPPGTSWEPEGTPQDPHPEYDTIPQEGCRDLRRTLMGLYGVSNHPLMVLVTRIVT